MQFPVAPGGTASDAAALHAFQLANNVELMIWGCTGIKHSTGIIYCSPFYKQTVRDGWVRITLLLYDGHYAWVKNPSGFMQAQWSEHKEHGGICFHCGQVHRDKIAAKKHFEDGYCLKFLPAKCILPKPGDALFNASTLDAAATLPSDIFGTWDIECWQKLMALAYKPRWLERSDGHTMSGVAWSLCCPHDDIKVKMAAI